MKKLQIIFLSLLVLVAFSQHADAYSFTISTEPDGTGTPATVEFEILGDGTNEITFNVTVLDPIADIRGVYFDIASGEFADFDIVGTDVTSFLTGTDIDTAGSPSSSINPVDPDGSFDVGVEIGTQGMSPDDIFSTSFTLFNDNALTLGDVFGVRLMSVGTEDDREGSSKLIGTYDPAPPVPETGTVFLLGVGLIGLTGASRKLKRT